MKQWVFIKIYKSHLTSMKLKSGLRLSPHMRSLTSIRLEGRIIDRRLKIAILQIILLGKSIMNSTWDSLGKASYPEQEEIAYLW